MHDTDANLVRGKFRVRGDAVDCASYDEHAVRRLVVR